MTKLTLLVFVFALISTGYLQELSNKLFEQLTNDNANNLGTPLSLLQNYPVQQRKVKPCIRRRNNNPNQPWIPSYSSQITQSLNDPAVLQPQALKNDQHMDSALSPENQNSDKTLNANDVGEDCTEQLESTNGNAEETALKIIEDCLKKKQKNKDAISLPARRSFFSAPDDADDEEDSEGALFGNLPAPSNGRDEENKESEINRRKVASQDSQITTSSKSLEPETSRAGTSPAFGSSLQNLRICYACSTATNPSCWEPDKTTTIKYCTTEQSCVTKTYGAKNSMTLIRDCANSCKDSSIPGLEPKFKSCKLCHYDYCNSAITITGYNTAIILIIGIVKYTF